MFQNKKQYVKLSSEMKVKGIESKHKWSNIIFMNKNEFETKISALIRCHLIKQNWLIDKKLER